MLFSGDFSAVVCQSDSGSGSAQTGGVSGGASGGAVKDILADKGGEIHTITTGHTVQEVIDTLNSFKIGALVVADDNNCPIGIVSERDVVVGIGQKGKELFAEKVDTIMTANPVCCAPDARVHDVMQKMTDGRFRHMPVVSDGKLCGMISIGDVVRKRLLELEYENKQMMAYMSG
ncbi:CBS domain-containing protein [Kiloniella litopenaei]|uniref:CBS domain-containing protein n=1 Tax=Kiloniella litopenaei TaxID=1549748 RepID=UPI0009E2D921|nr:CBS domain-containing protein [Kiloniella litopenaei]